VDVVLFAGGSREVLVPHIIRKRDDDGKADICDSRLLSETSAQLVVELHQRIALKWLLVHAEGDVLDTVRVETGSGSIEANEA